MLLHVPIIGVGTRANSYRPVIANFLDHWEAHIPSQQNGQPRFGDSIIQIRNADIPRVPAMHRIIRSVEQAREIILDREPFAAFDTWIKKIDPPRVVLATDNFDRPDNLDLGILWDAYGAPFNPCQIVTNQVRPGATGGDDTLESFNGVAFPNDQWAQCTIVNILTDGIGSSSGGIILRAAVPPIRSMYVGIEQIDSTSTPGQRIYKWVAGVFTSLAASALANNPNDILAMESRLTLLELFQNNSSILSVPDGSLISGQTGIECFTSTASTANARVDSWQAGGFAEGEGSFQLLRHGGGGHLARRSRRRLV